MDSFVEAQNSLKRMSDRGVRHSVSKRGKAAQCRFSFIPVVVKSPGLKPIEARNARSSSAHLRYPNQSTEYRAATALTRM
jgi:hypothetical protein